MEYGEPVSSQRLHGEDAAAAGRRSSVQPAGNIGFHVRDFFCVRNVVGGIHIFSISCDTTIPGKNLSRNKIRFKCIN